MNETKKIKKKNIKLRVVYKRDKYFPYLPYQGYVIQEKGWFFWHRIDIRETQQEAIEFMHEFLEKRKEQETVIEINTEILKTHKEDDLNGALSIVQKDQEN